MSEIDFTAISPTSVATPASGVGAIFIDSLSKNLMQKDDTGIVNGFRASQSVTTPGAGFATDTYLVGSSIAIPNGFLRAGTIYRIKFDIVKTAAGTATPIFQIRIGTAGAVGDTSRLTFTFAVGTAAIDTGIVQLDVLFRTVGSGTTAVMQGVGHIAHHLAATGITSTGASGNGIIIGTSAGFDSTPSNQFIGLSVNGGTSAAWTITSVRSQLRNE